MDGHGEDGVRRDSLSRRDALKAALKGASYAASVALVFALPRTIAAAAPVMQSSASPLVPSSGKFVTAMHQQVGFGPIAVASGDFNGNGKADLAVVNVGDQTVGVLISKSNGTFDPPASYCYSST